MATPNSLISPDAPAELPGTHDQLRTYIGNVGGDLFLRLANVPWLAQKLDELLHGGENSSHRRTDEVTLEEDANIPGFRDVYVHGARTELRRDGRVDVREILLELYSHDQALVVDGWVPDRNIRLARVDTVGLDNQGNAFINGSNEHTSTMVAGNGSEQAPDWRQSVRADRIALRVAAVSLEVVDLGWPMIVDAGLRSDSMRKFEAWHTELGEMLGEYPDGPIPAVWYARLPGTAQIADQVVTF